MSRIENEGVSTDQLKDKAGEVAGNLKDLGSQVKDAATTQYSQARDQASEYLNHGRETAKEWESQLETFVQEKPLQAVLIAAGVGMLLGLIWKRS